MIQTVVSSDFSQINNNNNNNILISNALLLTKGFVKNKKKQKVITLYIYIISADYKFTTFKTLPFKKKKKKIFFIQLLFFGKNKS